ncbi:MAG: hypothetical protein PHU75_00445 [Candidatus Nanopelagicales bacterium]|nr:hypothetical protein [Candidatus Nanopelagicales bacterium]
MQTDPATLRQVRFGVFLQSFAAILLIGTGIVRWTAFGFDIWAFVTILAGLGSATAAFFLVRVLRRA